MGIVLAAEDVQLGRPVAIKVMRQPLARMSTSRERFLREAKAMAAVEDEHVVPIYQVGQERGVPYFVMPLLKGESLEARLRREERLSVAEVIQLGIETALGLAAAHAHGLIHRDVKPGNIWCEPRPAEPPGRKPDREGLLEGDHPGSRFKLLDFGLVRVTEDPGDLTATGTIAGTPAYVAPEQARGEKVDERTDLFSLGCVMYQACTGNRPFGGDNPTALLWAVTATPPKRVLDLNADLPPRLALIIERLLEKDPEQRFQTAAELAQELSALEAERWRSAASKKAVETLPRPAQQSPFRHHSLFAAVALATLLLALAAWGVLTIRFRTPQGTIIVELEDPNLDGASLSVDGIQAVTIQTRPNADPIKLELDPGTYTLKITKPGFEPYAAKCTLRAHEDAVVRVKLQKLPSSLHPAERPPATANVERQADNVVRLRIAPGLRSGRLPGIVPQPTRLAGLNRWQLETHAPRGDILVAAWNPDGTRIACGTALGQIRFYDARSGDLAMLVVAHRGKVKSRSHPRRTRRTCLFSVLQFDWPNAGDGWLGRSCPHLGPRPRDPQIDRRRQSGGLASLGRRVGL
jgi:hypothetical protein